MMEIEVKKKQEASNKARLQSLKHRHEHYNQSKQIIQASLKNLNVSKKQHIFFDDEDDENTIPIKKAKTDLLPIKMLNTCDEKVVLEENTSSSNKKDMIFKKNFTLNDKTSIFKSKIRDPLNIENETEDMAFLEVSSNKNSSRKQRALQEQVGKDKRFKIDGRFVEDDVDKSDISELHKISNEVKANLAVFHQVMGPPTVVNLGKQSVHFSDPSAKRYDPSAEAKNESKPANEATYLEPKSKKKKSIPKVSKKQFYDVSTIDLKQAFAKTEVSEVEKTTDDKPFSLLSMLGRDKEEEEHIVNDIASYRTEKFEKLNHLVSQLHSSKIFEYDSDMSGSDVDESDIEKIKSNDIDLPTDIEDGEKFFLLSKLSSKFDVAKQLSCRHKLDKDWNEIRADVIEQSKNWYKNASLWSKTKKEENIKRCGHEVQ